MNTDIAKLSLRGIGVLIVMAIITALAVAFAVQTVRIDGLRLWPFSIEGLAVKVDRLEGDNARLITAQGLAAQDHADAKAEAEAKYQQLAKDIDDETRANMASGRDHVEQFIASGGVQGGRGIGCPSGQAFAAAENSSAGNIVGNGNAPQLSTAARTAAPPTFAARLNGPVAVLAGDVRICTENTYKAEAGHDLAVGLKALAVPSAEPIAETTTPVVPR